jgi:hypothetical protein
MGKKLDGIFVWKIINKVNNDVYLINFKYEISLAPAFAFRDSK